MTFLEPQDTVVLKADWDLVGTVERTTSAPDGWNDTSLEDLLIVNYTDVPERILIDFVNTGVPPRDYVFVICIDEEKGAFLAREDDFELLSRSFDLGDTVKRRGQTSSMIGTIIDYSETYTLQPVFYETANGDIRSRLDLRVKGGPETSCRGCDVLEENRDKIYNVSAEDVTHAQPIFEGDLVIRDDWVGAISSMEDIDIVLLVNDGIAILREPHLQTPIPAPEKPLVSLPEFDKIARPTVINAFQGWSTIPTLRTPRLGSLVVTSKDTLLKARWTRGQYAQPSNGGRSTPSHEGVVIGIVPRSIDVKWITSSPFSKKSLEDLSNPPSHRQTVFKNINHFKEQKDLKKKDGLVICDGSSYPPARSELTMSDSHRSVVNGSAPGRLAGIYQDLRTGDQVKFKDPYGAAVKYGATGVCGHNAFRRIDSASMGWDVNYLNVVGKTQQVTVQWQDGSTETHNSNELFRFAAFESALIPGNIVLDRAGLQMARAETDIGLSTYNVDMVRSPRSDFNEMAFFENPHDLFPSKVGVVQAVDHQERIAKVRWFVKPKVALTDAGELLSPGSLFGPVSDTVDEVSLYEIMTFHAFDWRIHDYVILPPFTTFERLQKSLKNKNDLNMYDGPLAVNPNLDLDRLIMRAQICLEDAEATRNAVCVDNVDMGDSAWVGEIVSIGLDGQLSVRMRGITKCRDIRIPLDVVLATISTEELNLQEYDAEGDELEEWFEDYVSGGEDYDSRSPSPISEKIEYEGGERMDEDEDDDAWVSAEEDIDGVEDDVLPYTEESSKPGVRAVDEDIEMTDASTQTPSAQPHAQVTTQTPTAQPPRIGLAYTVPPEAPPSFDVLSIPPPADQYSGDLDPNTSTAFLKRISKEHKTLASSLPEGQIYVRTYESRLDLLRCLIIGPPDTPYEDAPFLVDLYLGRNFPEEPPVAHFHSWTSGLGRINPNLYEEGKICLSLLGTWPGKDSKEGWSKDATILQVLVSLQGLVMVRNPFFNEAGFEGYEAEGAYKLEAAQYAEKAFVMARGFVKHALMRPPRGFEDVLGWLYATPASISENHESRRDLLKRIIVRGLHLIGKSEAARLLTAGEEGDGGEVQLMDAAGSTGDPTKAFLRPLSKGAVVMLRRTLAELEAASEQS